MIIDMRYHIVSLVSVFLALALGILIGNALGDRVLVKQQTLLIERLEADVNRLTGERRDLQREVATERDAHASADRFGRAVLPVLVADRLYGKQVVLVRLNPGAEVRPLEELQSVLRKAGAEVAMSLTFLQDPAAMAPEKRAGAATILGVTDPAAAGLPVEVLRGVARELARGTPTLLTSYLVDAQVISSQGGTKRPAQMAIVVGGATDEARAGAARSLDLPLIDALRAVGLTVAAVETSDLKVSLIKQYRSKGVLTVDDVDTPAGQLALVWGLATGKTDNYGVKETARQFLPLTGEYSLP